MKKRIIIVALALALAISGSAILIGCGSSDSNPNVLRISDTSKQKSNGVDTTNYQVIVKADVDWTGMSDSERQKITDFGVKKSREMAKDSGVSTYNIIGQKEDGTQIFLYNKLDNTVHIYDGVAGNSTQIGTLQAPAIEE